MIVNFAITLAVGACLTGVTVPALAQTASVQTVDTGDTSQLEEVVVTGSLIKRTEKESAEAVTILKADLLKDQGIENVEQALNTITSSNPSVNIEHEVACPFSLRFPY